MCSWYGRRNSWYFYPQTEPTTQNEIKSNVFEIDNSGEEDKNDSPYTYVT